MHVVVVDEDDIDIDTDPAPARIPIVEDDASPAPDMARELNEAGQRHRLARALSEIRLGSFPGARDRRGAP